MGGASVVVPRCCRQGLFGGFDLLCVGVSLSSSFLSWLFLLYINIKIGKNRC